MPASNPATASTDFVGKDLFRLTVDQYHELIDAGILVDGDPVELLEGVLFHQMTRNSPHATGVRRARRAIEPILPNGFFYDSEQAVTLSDGEPEPDGAVVRGSIDDYAGHHPGPADLLLVIEVADATLVRDRGIKLRSYARAGIPVYWIVNLVDRQVEVHTDPDSAGVPVPTYRRREVFTGDMLVPVAVANAAVTAAALLPPIR